MKWLNRIMTFTCLLYTSLCWIWWKALSLSSKYQPWQGPLFLQNGRGLRWSEWHGPHLNEEMCIRDRCVSTTLYCSKDWVFTKRTIYKFFKFSQSAENHYQKIKSKRNPTGRVTHDAKHYVMPSLLYTDSLTYAAPSFWPLLRQYVNARLEAFQSRTLCFIFNSPWYVLNDVIRQGLKVPV